MLKCESCGKSITIFNRFTRHAPDGTKVIVCIDCKTLLTKKERRQQLERIIANTPKIKCPYCNESFPKLTDEQYRDGVALNVLQWTVVPKRGVFIGGANSQPYIECPYCLMKIPQEDIY